MAAKFFGQFLLEKGVIDSAQLLRALDLQRTSNPALGELACARGMLSQAQAQAVNERQRSEDKRFGDIAQSMGLLTDVEVGQLLDEQKSRRKLFGEILVDEGMLSREQLDAELREHAGERDEAVKSLDAVLASHQLGRRVANAISTCNKLFPRILRTQCQFSSVLDPKHPPACDALALIRIAADRPIAIGMACDTATMNAMALAFMSIPADAMDDELARDALGELVNTLMGYVVRDSIAEDSSYSASPPDFDTSLASLDDGMHVLIGMTSQLGPFVLVLGD